jgi:hypothetical protein
MAEFALVLPLLALLTFGTLEVALYLQQQSSINAAAFVAARSASVLGNNEPATRASLSEYVDAAGMPWLAQATITNEGKAGKLSAYSVTAGSDRLTGLLAGLSNGQVSGFDTLSAGAALPLEYDSSKVKSTKHAKDPKYRPRTRSMLQYQSKEDAKLDLLRGSALMAQTAFDRLVAIRDALAQPAPKPSAKPSAKPGPNNGPAKPQPPAPAPQPAVPPVDIPVVKLAKGVEPYSDLKPIVGNPKHRNDAGGDGRDEAFAQDYTGPEYEKSEQLKAGVAYKMKNIAGGLQTYEGTLGKPNEPKTVENAARKLGEAAKISKNPLVVGFVKEVTGFVGQMNRSLEKPYRDYRKNEEQVLFKRQRP